MKEFLCVLLGVAFVAGIMLIAHRTKPTESIIQVNEDRIELMQVKIDSLSILLDERKIIVEELEKERNLLKFELSTLKSKHEKTDFEILSGDIDYNVSFLSGFLSKEISFGR